MTHGQAESLILKALQAVNMISSQEVDMEENKIFDSEFVNEVKHMNFAPHQILRVLKIMVTKCAQLEAEIMQLKNGNENKV